MVPPRNKEVLINLNNVSVVLRRFGYDDDELSSERVMARVRSGILSFLVATDVAVRGIDIPDLSHVKMSRRKSRKSIFTERAVRGVSRRAASPSRLWPGWNS